MRRPFVMTTSALAIALLPAAVFAQTPPAQTPAQPPAAAQPAPADKPAEPKLGFTTPAGLLLVQVKPDQTAAFEELAAKLQAALSTTSDAALKAQGAALEDLQGVGADAVATRSTSSSSTPRSPAPSTTRSTCCTRR